MESYLTDMSSYTCGVMFNKHVFLYLWSHVYQTHVSIPVKSCLTDMFSYTCVVFLTHMFLYLWTRSTDLACKVSAYCASVWLSGFLTSLGWCSSNICTTVSILFLFTNVKQCVVSFSVAMFYNVSLTHGSYCRQPDRVCDYFTCEIKPPYHVSLDFTNVC